jgi:cytochrome P450
VDIPAGARLLLMLGAAGRDGERFADPGRFDVRRMDAARHLAFGMGAHFCFGAPLARMAARTVLQLLTSVAPDLELVPGQRLDFPPNLSFRGPRQLWLRLGADSDSGTRGARRTDEQCEAVRLVGRPRREAADP